MFKNLKKKIFPCCEKLNTVMNENKQAAKELSEVCKQNKFPELKEGHVVNPS